MKHFYFLFSVFVLNCVVVNAQEIISPGKNIKVELTNEKSSEDNLYGRIYFRILYKDDSEYVEVLPNSLLGITRDDQQFTDNLSLVEESDAVTIHDRYQMLCGKRKLCENFGTEKVFSYKNSVDQPLDIVFRVYNDGVAFRYTFPNHSDSLVNITGEATIYVLPDSTFRWMQPFNDVYEDFFPFSKTGLSEKKEQI